MHYVTCIFIFIYLLSFINCTKSFPDFCTVVVMCGVLRFYESHLKLKCIIIIIRKKIYAQVVT